MVSRTNLSIGFRLHLGQLPLETGNLTGSNVVRRSLLPTLKRGERCGALVNPNRHAFRKHLRCHIRILFLTNVFRFLMSMGQVLLHPNLVDATVSGTSFTGC
jgi:hypothetical protein